MIGSPFDSIAGVKSPPYVMTVGTSFPVSSFIMDKAIARSARLFNATGAASLCLVTSLSNCSKYTRIVAPALPVPLNRNTTRAVFPLPNSNLSIKPCLDVWEPSTGSV
jgi:hypothetical protein